MADRWVTLDNGVHVLIKSGQTLDEAISQLDDKSKGTNSRPNEAKLRNYGIDTREMAKQYIGNDKLQALADKLDVSIDDLSEDELLKYMSDDEIADMMRINGVDFDDDYESDFEEDEEEKPYNFDDFDFPKEQHIGYIDTTKTYKPEEILKIVSSDKDWDVIAGSGFEDGDVWFKHKSGPHYVWNRKSGEIKLISKNAASRYEGV